MNDFLVPFIFSHSFVIALPLSGAACHFYSDGKCGILLIHSHMSYQLTTVTAISSSSASSSSFLRSFLFSKIDQAHHFSIHLHLCHSNHTLISSATPLLKAFKITHLPSRIYSDWCSVFSVVILFSSAIKVVADATASTNRNGFDRMRRRNNGKVFRFGFMLLFALVALVTVYALSAVNKSNQSVSSQFATVSMDV